MCGLTHVTVAALFSSCSLLCISNSDWATENEAGRSVSVNGSEEPRWRDLSPIQFSCNCNYSLITHNKTPVHPTLGLLSVCVCVCVCAACPNPRLNLSSELRPFWEQHPRYVPHRVRNGYNTTLHRGISNRDIRYHFQYPSSIYNKTAVVDIDTSLLILYLSQLE